MHDLQGSHETPGTPPPARRVLGLDVGTRRIGVALSGLLGMPAQPLLTLGSSHPRQTLKDLGRLVRKHNVGTFVVGHPLHMSGEPSPQAAKVQAFAATLREAVALPVHLQDERLSSAAAEELMDRLGLPRGPERKARLDQYAAVVILQDWLDAEERRSTLATTHPMNPDRYTNG